MTQVSFSDSGASHLWKLVEDLGKFVSVFTSALLVLSTAYDLSFLYALGLTFEELPSTLSDHVRSAIVWVPKALLYIGGFAVYEMLMRRVEGGLSEEELIASSRNPRFMRFFRRGPQIIFMVLIPTGIAVEFFLSTSEQGIFFLALFAWGTLSLSIVEHPRLGIGFTKTTRRLFVVIPIVVIWVATLGYSRGTAMMSARVPNWSVTLTVGTETVTRSLVGMRRFSEAAILVEPGRHVSIVSADSILRADALRQPGDDVPRLCRWFNALCPKQIPSVP
ncbi:hypothetical protein MCEMSHM24_03158 [Comamonadaceae bacterium]